MSRTQNAAKWASDTIVDTLNWASTIARGGRVSDQA